MNDNTTNDEMVEAHALDQPQQEGGEGIPAYLVRKPVEQKPEATEPEQAETPAT